MFRLASLLGLFLLALAACDTTQQQDFVAGELLVTLQDGVTVADFRPYVESAPDLSLKGVVGGEYVLLGVPEGKEEATARRLEVDARAFVASAQLNHVVRLDG